MFLILLYCQVPCYLDIYALLHVVFALITQHAVTVDRMITTAKQIGIIISIGVSADFIGALVFREIVGDFVPALVGLDIIQLALVKDLVGALLEMRGPPVVTPVVWVVGRVLEVPYSTILVRHLNKAPL